MAAFFYYNLIFIYLIIVRELNFISPITDLKLTYTIDARKNLKLHIQHVPRRYWKYLIEKQ